jgi:hypothetical protein
LATIVVAGNATGTNVTTRRIARDILLYKVSLFIAILIAEESTRIRLLAMVLILSERMRLSVSNATRLFRGDAHCKTEFRLARGCLAEPFVPAFLPIFEDRGVHTALRVFVFFLGSATALALHVTRWHAENLPVRVDNVEVVLFSTILATFCHTFGALDVFAGTLFAVSLLSQAVAVFLNLAIERRRGVRYGGHDLFAQVFRSVDLPVQVFTLGLGFHLDRVHRNLKF